MKTTKDGGNVMFPSRGLNSNRILPPSTRINRKKSNYHWSYIHRQSGSRNPSTRTRIHPFINTSTSDPLINVSSPVSANDITAADVQRIVSEALSQCTNPWIPSPTSNRPKTTHNGVQRLFAWWPIPAPDVSGVLHVMVLKWMNI